jgi:DNA-binding MarR family transcriptional regulator
MTDIISSHRKSRTSPALATRDGETPTADAPSDPSLLPLVEMLFFAYRDFTGEADAILETYGLGRAHHRVLHFVNRRAGIRVADLLELLKITKQSLGRVLRKLVADGWIVQSTGADDRRERHLTLTTRGHTLASELVALQTRRIDGALRELEVAGAPGLAAREHVRGFLFALIADGERASVRDIIAVQPVAKSTRSKREVGE